jgi:hypothetical protein
MKYAICIWGQLRAVSVVIESLKKYVIDPLQMDLYVYAQKTNTDIDNHLDLYPSKNKIIYNSSDVTKTFVNYDVLIKKNNYVLDRYLKVYENWYKIAQLWGDEFEKYDSIVLSRSDFLHLFPFPDVSTLYPNKDLIWCYNGCEWDGINYNLVVVPSKYIKKYLTCAYDFLQNPSMVPFLNKQDLNTEKFFKLLFQYHHWNIGKIQPNSFITASGKHEITTWAQIEYSRVHNVYYKYIDQLNDAYTALKQSKSNKWILKDKKIILKQPMPLVKQNKIITRFRNIINR